MFLMKVRSRKRERNLRSIILPLCTSALGEWVAWNAIMNQKNRQQGGGLRHLDSFYMITPAIFNCIPVDGFELFNHLSNKEGRKTRTVWAPPRAGLAPSPPRRRPHQPRPSLWSRRQRRIYTHVEETANKTDPKKLGLPK